MQIGDDLAPPRNPLRPMFFASALFAALLGVARWTYVVAYRLQGDDFALVLNSSAPYVGVREWSKWFTEGYSTYFANYPDWPGAGTDFSRPLVNLAFAAQGVVAEAIGDPAYLIVGYLSVVVAVALVAGILITQTDVSTSTAVTFAVVFGMSPALYPALSSASFASTSLALMFGAGALFVLDPRRGRPQGVRLAACILLQVAAVLCHETSVVLPFVSVALLFTFGYQVSRWRELVAFVVPVGVFVAGRLLLESADGVYALTSYGLWSAVKRIGAFVVGPLAPFDLFGPLLGQSVVTPTSAGVYALAIAANAALLVLVILGVVERPSRSAAWGMAAALLIARLPGLAGRMEPRFLGIAFIVVLVCAMQVKATGSRSRLRSAAVALLMLSHGGLFYQGVVQEQAEEVAFAREAGVFFDALREEIHREAPSTVVLVNDRYGLYGVRAMVEMAAWPRRDVQVVVTNSYVGELAARGGALEIGAHDDLLDVTTRMGEDQTLMFAGAVPELSVSNLGFAYEAAEVDSEGEIRVLRVIGSLGERDTLVVGIDPSTGMFRAVLP